jgi:hypothetical protein
MSGNNGNGKAGDLLEFGNRRDVPIIGQPFTIKGWLPTVLIVCNCEGKEPLLIQRSSPTVCPTCKRTFTVAQVVGQVNFGIGVAAPEPEHAPVLTGGTTS